jgi:hypothetical protein
VESPQRITFRLQDSLPAQALERVAHAIRHLEESRCDPERGHRIDGLLDGGHGACALRRPEAASAVQDALLEFDDMPAGG